MTNKLTRLKLNEISLVDKGANPGAHVLLMKRHTEPTEADLDRLIEVFAKAEESPETFADALDDMIAEQDTWRAMDGIYDLVSALRETIESIVSGDADDKAGLVSTAVQDFGAAVEGKAPELAAVLKAGTPGSKPSNSKETDMSKELESKVGDLEAQIAKMAADNAEVAKMATYCDAVSKLSDVEKTHLETLDEAGQDTFLKASADDRAAVITKAASSDETLDGPDGTTIRKSEVGDGVFAMLKKQSDDNKVMAEQIEKQNRDGEVATIAKSFDGVAFAKADELASAIYELRKSNPDHAQVLEKALTAAQAQFAEGDILTKRLGTNTLTEGEASAEIEKQAKEIFAKGTEPGIEAARAAVRKNDPALAQRERDERAAA